MTSWSRNQLVTVAGYTSDSPGALEPAEAAELYHDIRMPARENLISSLEHDDYVLIRVRVYHDSINDRSSHGDGDRYGH